MGIPTKARHVAVTVTGVALAASALSGCSSPGATQDGVTTISFLSGGNDPTSIAFATDIVAAFEEENPDVKVKIENRPAGTDGDNLIKTRLSTGEMSDVFFYNSGSLFQTLRPDTQLQVLGDEAWAELVTDDFRETVSTSQGLYGAPVGSTYNGGIIYNKKVYKDLGLEIPTTWDAFISNSEVIRDAGIVPVIQSFGDTWTSQIFVLADFANVSAQVPDWADAYTANEDRAKYANEPALAGFRHTQEIFDRGLMNKDYASLTNVNALKMLATGQGAQYPMVTSVMSNLVQSNPDEVDDLGYFAMPTNTGEPHATVWEPGAAFIPKTTTGEKLIAAKKFIAFLNSEKGCDIQTGAGTPAGPFAISTCEVPDGAPALVQDVLRYQEDQRTGLALEFVSPVKGPNLEKILVQVGSGISSAEEGAALYDQDVKAQAQQLGLEGW